MLARSSLENSKLELVGQLSDAKRKLVTVEREKLDLLEKCKKLEVNLLDLLFNLHLNCFLFVYQIINYL